MPKRKSKKRVRDESTPEMHGKDSLVDQLTKTLKGRAPAYIPQVLIGEWSLDTVKTGFVMSKRQFVKLSTIMLTRAAELCGTWSVMFYPKSGHLVTGTSMLHPMVFPLLALSKNFEYYKWLHGPSLACDWVNFAVRVINENRDYDFVLFARAKADNDDRSTDLLRTFSIKTGLVHQGTMHVGGGRIYNEDSAIPYTESQTDTIVRA